MRERHPVMRPFNPTLRNWQGVSVWVVGSSSGIGQAVAAALHAAGARVAVSARQAGLLEAFAAVHRGVLALPLDVTQADAVRAAAQQVQTHQGLDLVVYCAGHYTPLRADAFQLDTLLKHQAINYQGALHVLDAVLPTLRTQGHGHLSLVASVAGYRGLPNSLAYGPTKAALIHLAEVLYLDLQPLGIGVSVVNPGFVRTPMTAGNPFHMPALITPEEAAQHMLRGWAQGAFEMHFPKRFTRWLRVLRLLPYRLYFALVRRATGL